MKHLGDITKINGANVPATMVVIGGSPCQGKSYSITHPDGRINIGEGYYIKDGKNYNVLSNEPCIDIEGMWGDTADDILEYNVGGDRLRDVITQVEVVVRTI